MAFVNNLLTMFAPRSVAPAAPTGDVLGFIEIQLLSQIVAELRSLNQAIQGGSILPAVTTVNTSVIIQETVADAIASTPPPDDRPTEAELSAEDLVSDTTVIGSPDPDTIDPVTGELVPAPPVSGPSSVPPYKGDPNLSLEPFEGTLIGFTNGVYRTSDPFTGMWREVPFEMNSITYEEWSYMAHSPDRNAVFYTFAGFAVGWDEGG
jgi:hypothetical protein